MKLFTLIFLFLSTTILAQKAYIVINEADGSILAEHNSTLKHYPASLTKMMLLYIVFDALKKNILKENTLLKVSKKASDQIPSKLGLKINSTITLKNTILGIIIKSANDASVVLSEHLSGKEKTFASIMTATAKQIGLSKTNFKNSSGLGDEDQISSAKDMALLGLALYRHFPKYYKWFSIKSFVFQGKKIYSHNHLFKRYKGVDGLKTGYIKKAGYNSVVSSKQNGKRLFGVVLGAESIIKRDNKMIEILNKGFAQLGVNVNYSRENEKYTVQLGAFSNKNNAEKILKNYKQNKKIIKKNVKNKTLYLALLTNLSYDIAYRKCNKIKSKGKECLIKLEK